MESGEKLFVENRPYRLANALGSGSFGTTFKALPIEEGPILAVKRLDIGGSHAKERPFYIRLLTHGIRTRIELAAELGDAGVVQAFDPELAEKGIFCTEYAEGENLHDFHRRNLVRDREARRTGVRDYLELGFQAFRHAGKRMDVGALHLDTKKENFLRNSTNATIMLCDLDFFTRADISQLFQIPLGSPSTMAPEIVRNEKPHRASDVYSVACMVVLLIQELLDFEVIPMSIGYERFLELRKDGRYFTQVQRERLQQLRERLPQEHRSRAKNLFTACAQSLEDQANDRPRSSAEIESLLNPPPLPRAA